MIKFNYKELKQELKLSLEKYRDLVFTKNTMEDEKYTRAKLNKLKTAIYNKKKIKSDCLKPYKTFEVKIKELTSLIDEPMLYIDNQTYEETIKNNKK